MLSLTLSGHRFLRSLQTLLNRAHDSDPGLILRYDQSPYMDKDEIRSGWCNVL